MNTRLCDLLEIEFPIIQAGMSIFTGAELVAAVSVSGGPGSLGCWRRSAEDVVAEVARIRERTKLPFALNHVVPAIDESAFIASLKLRPAAISFALADPGERIKQVHDAGVLAIVQITTVAQALKAAENGADIIIAQGGESGGYAGRVSTMALVPQVIDAVPKIPIVASGGIADGRGLAAALALGAAGINIGTRFLASIEAPIHAQYKEMITRAEADDIVSADFVNCIDPIPGAVGYGTSLQSIRTPFVDRWRDRLSEARSHADTLRAELAEAMRGGRRYELLAGAGQSTGLIHDIIPAGEIVRRIVTEARHALKNVQRYAG
jgi:nitronate monooxygenase/enoyl-[acyl-carrier protein] reductase II